MTDATRFITLSFLKVAAPHLPVETLAPWVAPIRSVCQRHSITTFRRIAAFVATLAHEGGFKVGVRENMNYSARRLSQVWPGRFRFAGMPNRLALAIGGNAVLIANHVYANRMGNGGPETGDGWRYRGNGPMQLTGKHNHRAFAQEYDKSVEEAAEWIGTLEGGIESAAWFWEENDINRLADTPGVADETKRINGGEIGIEHRRKIFDALVAHMLSEERKAA